jgi:hypothetical protein
LLPQNIGSNAFYKDLESQLLQLFPNGNEITAPDLVKLCKSTALFHFQNPALFQKIQDISINYMENLSNPQIETILWSFTKGGRGSLPLYESLEKEIIKRAALFKPRSLAFAYEGLSRMNRKFNLTKALLALEKQILLKIDAFSLHSHYLVKILKGIKQQRKQFQGEIFQNVSEALLKNENLKFSEIVDILLMLGENKSRDESSSRNQVFERFETKLKASSPFLKPEQICAVYYSYTATNAWKDSEFFKEVSSRLPAAISVPKNLFCQTMWAAVQNNRVALAAEFVRIINNMLEFGDVRFFFDHDNFVKMSWSSIVIHHILNEDQEYSGEKFHKHYWASVRDAVLDINPNTLQTESLKLWLQVLNLLDSVIEVKQQDIEAKTSEINEFLTKELASLEEFSSVSDEVRNDCFEEIKIFFNSLKKENTSGTQFEYDFKVKTLDDRKNFLDIAIITKEVGTGTTVDKIGVRILETRSFLLGVEDVQNLLRETEVEIRILEKAGWQLLVIKEKFWKDMGDTQKRLFIKEQVSGFVQKSSAAAAREVQSTKPRRKINKRK